MTIRRTKVAALPCKAKQIGAAIVVLFIVTGCVGTFFGEPLPQEEARFQKVVNVTLPKDEMFSKTREWLAKEFKSSKKVIELEDEESGKIIGNGSSYLSNGPAQIPYTFTMSIEMKDNRYRMTCENIVVHWGSGPHPLSSQRNKVQVHQDFTRLCNDLTSFLLKEGDDW